MKNNWKIISAIVLIFSFFGGVWAFDDRYCTNKALASTLEKFQEQTQQTIKQFQLKVQLQFYQMMYDSLTKEMFTYKRMIREDPNDQDIKEEYDRIIDERKEIKTKIQKLMEQIDG